MNYETTVDLDKDSGGAATGHYHPGAQLDGTDAVTSKRLKYMLVALAAIVVMITAYVMMTSGSGEPQFAAGGGGQVPTVTVVTPGRTTVAGEITATGTLAARRAMPVGVVGEGGRVVSVQVDAGDWVSAGQVLVVIDRSVQMQQADSSAAQIEVSKADAELAQANLDRALQLVERGFISQAEIDRLTATRDAAVARVRVTEAQYRELLARNARLNVIAPAAGLVLERNVEPGQVVSPGAGALFTIARGGELEMLAEVGETELASIRSGALATVVPVGTDKEFTGQVWQVAPTISEQDRQGTARIALPYAVELRPGGFATATIGGGTVVAPLLPESAVMNDDRGNYVYVIDKDNKVVRTPVTTGLITDEGIVIAEGLAGTESIVLRAGGFLTEGETVNPVAVDSGS
jgi:RND family efflux transporter MFP subunit